MLVEYPRIEDDHEDPSNVNNMSVSLICCCMADPPIWGNSPERRLVINVPPERKNLITGKKLRGKINNTSKLLKASKNAFQNSPYRTFS